MATYIGGPSYAVSGEDLGRFAGFKHQNPYQEALYDYFEQAFASDPYRLAAGVDIEPYLQGVNIANQPSGFGWAPTGLNPQNETAANTILQRMAAAGQAPQGWSPWAGDFNARQDARGGGFTAGIGGIDDFIGDAIFGDTGVLDVAGELWDEPGVKALLAAGTAGAFMGGGLGGAGIGAGTGVPAGLSEEAAMLGLGDIGGGLAEEAAMLGIGDLGSAGSAIGLGGAAAGLGSLIPGIGDILKGIGGVMPSANTAAALAPIIAAIAYAKNQGPFDTSRLTSTYDQFEPDALAYDFDQNTSAGRNALTSSLTKRGVMGSSFGNMDLTNFQTTRDLGRRSLVNQGLAARGGLANNLLEAQFKERQLKNQLYGTSLLALGNVFGGRSQPTAGV